MVVHLDPEFPDQQVHAMRLCPPGTSCSLRDLGARIRGLPDRVGRVYEAACAPVEVHLFVTELLIGSAVED